MATGTPPSKPTDPATPPTPATGPNGEPLEGNEPNIERFGGFADAETPPKQNE